MLLCFSEAVFTGEAAHSILQAKFYRVTSFPEQQTAKAPARHDDCHSQYKFLTSMSLLGGFLSPIPQSLGLQACNFTHNNTRAEPVTNLFCLFPGRK